MASQTQFTDLIVPNGGINESVSPNKIKPNEWTTGLNVEPLFDGVRRRKGSSASNAIALQAIQQSHEVGTADREFHDSGSLHMSQGFQDAAAMTVSRVAVRMKAQGTAASMTGSVVCAIFTDDGGSPNKPLAKVDGLDTTDFSSIDPTTLTTEYKWYYFTVTTGVALTLATTYHLVITHAATETTGGNNVLIEEDTGDTYATETGYRSGDKAVWTATSADLNFRIYSGTAAVTMIANYRLSDASTAYHLVMADGELYKNVSGTMTALSARDRLTLTASADVHPTWGVMNDRFAFTNDTEVSKLFYDLSGTEYYENEGIAAPTNVPTIVASGTSDNLAEGAWYVDYYYYNEDTGVSSDRKYNGVSAPTATVSVTPGELLTIGNLPTAPVRENDRITHIRIELKGPDQTIFRYVTEITVADLITSGGVVVIDDDSFPADTAPFLPYGVEADYEHAVPPVHKLKCVAENRQFIADIADEPYSLMYSAIIGTTPHYHSFPALNKRQFGRGDGDYITALAFIPPRTLVVGMKNSIRAIDARRPGTSDVITISKNVGIAGPHAFKVVGKRLFFLSDADENKGPFVVEGAEPHAAAYRSEPKMLLGIDNTYKNFNATRMKYASCAHLAPGDTRFQWWTLVTASTASSTHDRILVYDYALDAWTIYTKPTNGANILGQIESSSVSQVFIGDNLGVEHLQDTTNEDSGTEYFSSLTLSAFGFGQPSVKKRFRWVDYVVSAQTTGGVGLSAAVDYGRGENIAASLQQIFEVSTATWDTGSTWSTSSTWGGASNQDAWARTSLCGRGFVFQPTLSFAETKTSSETFHLKGIAFGFQPLKNRVTTYG